MNTIIHMPGFWAIIFILTATALIFLLFPLFRSGSRKGKTLFLSVFIPLWLIAVPLLYWQWGAALRLQDTVALSKISQRLESTTKAANVSKEKILETFTLLEKEVDFSALALAQLGSIYNQLGLYDKAIEVYAKAIILDNDPEYRTQWIYAYSLKNQGKLPSDVRMEAEKLVQLSAKKEVINLLAIDDYFQGRFEQAAKGWELLLATDEELADDRRIMMQNALTKARKQGNLQEPSQNEILFNVHVSLAPALASAVGPEDMVFVFIKASEGHQPPLAVIKKKAKELPFIVDLGDEQSMMGGQPLKPGLSVNVIAKISKSGNPLDTQGELRGISPALVIKSGLHSVELIIDERSA